MRAPGFIAAVAATLAWSGDSGAQDLSLAQVERGRYLATAGNCVGCHTNVEEDGIPWSGGREMETPFGVIITPNITPDDATGLGLWTREEFRRALREGVRRDGAHLYPAFPYPYFTKMPDDDIDAIYDYLRTIEPVHAEHVPEEELPAPLRIRTAVLGWKTLHFEEGPLEADPEQSDAWNRGRYLVDGPAHCGACHTPKTLTGGDDADNYLRGGVLENWLAPNIRGGENGGIAAWSEDEIVEFLATGRANHTIAMSRMGEVVALSTQHLAEEDLRAMATYLKSLDDEPRDEADAPEEEVSAAGAALYFDNCAACHVSDGSGVANMFARLDGSNKVNSDDPTTIIRIVLEGARAEPTNAYPNPFAMPSFAWQLTDEQVADLLSYVRSAWGNAAPPVEASDVSSMRDALFGGTRGEAR